MLRGVGDGVGADEIAVVLRKRGVSEQRGLPALLFIPAELVQAGFEGGGCVVRGGLQLLDRIDFQLLLRDEEGIPPLRGDQDDGLIDGQAAVLPLRPAEVVEELQDVHMHEQRLAAAGGAHEGELVHFVRRVGRKADPPGRLRGDFLKKGVQIRAEGRSVGKIAVEVHLREQQGQVLEIFPADAAPFRADGLGVAADVFVVQAQPVFLPYLRLLKQNKIAGRSFAPGAR